MENNEEIKEETIGTQDGQAVKQKKGFKSRLNSFFKISERGSSVTVEVFAGLTTFLSMCYIFSRLSYADTRTAIPPMTRRRLRLRWLCSLRYSLQRRFAR